MSEENFEAARSPDDGDQQASHPHGQYDKDSTIEHGHSDGSADSGGTQGGGDTLTHEVGHWLGSEEPDVDDLTSQPPSPPEPAGPYQGGDTLTHEVGHWLGDEEPDVDDLTSQPPSPPEPAGPYDHGDTLTHEVGHWLGDEEPGLDTLTSSPTPPPPVAGHEVGHTLGFRHEHVVAPAADADKPRRRYFDGRFLSAVTIVALIALLTIGGLVILFNNSGSAAGSLKTIAAAQTDYNNAPANDPSDSGLFWFFSPTNTELADSCVEDYADLTVPICARVNTGPGDVITIQGAGFGYAEEPCGPVPVIRVAEPDTSAAISEAVTIVGDIGSEFTAPLQAQGTGMLLGIKTVDSHPTENVQLVLVVLPDPQTDGEKKDDYFVADSFSFGYADYGDIDLFVRSRDSSSGGGVSDQFFEIWVDPPSDTDLDFVLASDGNDPSGTLVALMAFVYESDLLAHLPPLCEPVSLPPADVTEEPTEEPPDSSVPVSTEEPTNSATEEPVEVPPAVCGDLVCDPSTENSDICPDDCQCVDDGVCSPGEGENCQDCGSSAGACGAVCAESSQCTEGLSCAGGVCWDAVICGGANPGGGGGGSCGYGKCGCDPKYKETNPNNPSCTTYYDTCGNSIQICN